MKKNYLTFFLFLSLFNFISAQSFFLEIFEIQGTTESSSYVGDYVQSSENVVTAIGDDFFFMQTPTSRSDNEVNTSDGIMVLYNNASTLQVGNLVTVTGYINEAFGRTQFDDEDLIVTVEANSSPIPNPVLLNENFPSGEAGGIPDLEKIEGMYVEVEPAVVTAATNEYDETTIKVGNVRSFREPGILYPAPNGLPEWDGNPEVFEFDPDGLGLENQKILSGGMIVYAKGVINYSFSDYQLMPTEYELFGSNVFRAVDNPEETEVSVASLNCYVLNNNSSNYLTRLNKISQYIVELMKSPDILAVQEVRSLNVLQNIASTVHQLDPSTIYTPFLVSSGQGGSFIIEVGYLVKSTVSDVQVTQLGASESFSLGGSLHYRPPLLLEGNLNNNPSKPIKVLNLHLKSLGGITGSNGDEVRLRRHEQAVSVANMVQNYANDNLVVLGDLNAFEFSDGYVDVVNQIAGTPSLGAEFPLVNIGNSTLENQMLTLPPNEQYSYVFQGNAQILDHCLTSDFTGMDITKLQFVRGNSDNPDIFENDISKPWRVSDHDGFVLFIDVGEPLAINNLNADPFFLIKYPNPFLENHNIEIDLENSEFVTMELVNINGQVVYQNDLGYLEKGNHSFGLPSSFSKGIYFLKIYGKEKSFIGKIIFQ